MSVLIENLDWKNPNFFKDDKQNLQISNENLEIAHETTILIKKEQDPVLNLLDPEAQ
jgi:hypothetical protein